MNQRDHIRARMILEDGAGRWYFPLGPLSRPRAVPDRQAEDWLLRDVRKGSWPLMVGVTLFFFAGLWAHLVDWNQLSMGLMALGLGLFLFMRQWAARQATRDWQQGPHWPLGRWLGLRAASRSWWLLSGQALAWGLLSFVGVMILIQGRDGSQLHGWIQAGVCGIAFLLELTTLALKLQSKEPR